MLRPRVALLVVDPVRDAPGIVLTAFELCQRGATCFVLPFSTRPGEIFALAPDFVLLPTIRPYPFSMTLQFVAAGIQFGFEEAEAATNSSILDFMRTVGADQDLAREVACVCCWSSVTAERIIWAGMFSRSKVTISGCPRFDYYSASLSKVYRTRCPTDIQPWPQTVLVDSNLGIASPYYQPKALAVSSAIRNRGLDRQQTGWNAIDSRSPHSMVNLANRLAEDFPAVNIVFNGDLRKLNERELSKLPNLRVTSAGNSMAGIIGSAAVVQNGCASAIDACLVQTPALSPQWIYVVGCDSVAEAVSTPCADYPQLRSTLNQVLTGSYKEPEERRRRTLSLIEDGFYKVDGMAHKRVATAILENLRSDIRPNLKRCRHYLYQFSGPSSLHPIDFPNRVGDQQDLPARDSALQHSADDPLSEREIRNLVNIINEAKIAEQPRVVSAYSANSGGAYFNYQYRGSAVVMTCN